MELECRILAGPRLVGEWLRGGANGDAHGAAHGAAAHDAPAHSHPCACHVDADGTGREGGKRDRNAHPYGHVTADEYAHRHTAAHGNRDAHADGHRDAASHCDAAPHRDAAADEYADSLAAHNTRSGRRATAVAG